MPKYTNQLKTLYICCALTLAAVGILSFLALVLLRYKNPAADVGILVNLCHTSLGYIAGTLNGSISNRGNHNRR